MGKNFPQDLNDCNEYRGMVHWFSPVVLLKTAKKVIDSTLFGQYADRRLVHAALDSPIIADTLIEECCGGKTGVCGEKDKEAIWLDYVADLGDGFDSTYAIAYLIGQKRIQVSTNESLPRADCLVMGGDQVYPDASREEYKKRMLRPYKAAFPKTPKPDACHPKVYLIPGNHDWYDGLNLFLANFCRGRETFVGSWVASQKRSYFAIHLGQNWWIWGFDSQLGEDIDKPQADYFTTVASKMPNDAKVILCASVPTWLKADIAGDKKGQEEYYRALHYVADILLTGCAGAKIPVVISGDLHHYSRYVGKETGTQFITAGGGGAFLHPTHHLSDTISTKWPGASGDEDTLEIARNGAVAESKKAMSPAQSVSKRLALGNLWFWYKNPDFCLVLGLLYLVCGLLILAWNGYGSVGADARFLDRLVTQIWLVAPSPVFVIVAFSLFLVFFFSAEIRVDIPGWKKRASEKLQKWRLRETSSSKLRRYTAQAAERSLVLAAFLASRKLHVVTLHWIAHVLVLTVGVSSISVLAAYLTPLGIFADLVYFLLLSLGLLLLGFIGGSIWGIYLTAASWFWGR
ncbi:MAG: metallophosphoesterase [Acidobacteria bacterium]|nr:metallophosphoesterase [Acidobacteriota bacterium]